MPDVAERVLTAGELPARLKDLPRPPSLLYVRGTLPGGPCVAIVGTRDPTPQALAFARDLARELALAGVSIVSGGACGIDTAAHEGALEAAGHTVVMAPSGFERPYPEQNFLLYRRIVECGGAYVSLVPATTPALPAAFFLRNACLAAQAQALVIVEAPFRSGARNAAAQARRLGRAVFVVPAAPWNPRGSGAIVELKLGAFPLASSRDVLEWLAERGLHGVRLESGLASRATRRRRAPTSQRAQCEPRQLVLSALRAGPLFPEQIAKRSGLAPADVQLSVLTLRLEGAVICDPAGLLSLRHS